MFKFTRKKILKNIGLKFTSLILALILWFYISDELNKANYDDKHFVSRVLPKESMSAKKLLIKPVFMGKTKSGFIIDNKKTEVVPEYCIVVGPRGMLDNLKYIYTLPIDINGAGKAFVKSVPLNPIAPGVYMEETLVQVTVPVERSNP